MNKPRNPRFALSRMLAERGVPFLACPDQDCASMFIWLPLPEQWQAKNDEPEPPKAA